jgi:hypothetical protein
VLQCVLLCELKCHPKQLLRTAGHEAAMAETLLLPAILLLLLPPLLQPLLHQQGHHAAAAGRIP